MDAISLSEIGDEQVAVATAARAGRAAHTIYGGREHALRQTILALAKGHGLDDHESPGEATLLVLRGRIRLATATANVEGVTGDYLVIPDERHNVAALADSVLLLTVVAR
ncbi:cupin [Mycobacterium neglectum]|uniref:cupin n=1 Tax=Mycobacterium neglectum TaxID=242737 RepID=UPI001FE73C70|nr:cupin [Mycobacterium neglectum]